MVNIMEQQPQLADEQQLSIDATSCRIDIQRVSKHCQLDECQSKRDAKDLSDHKLAGVKSTKFKLLVHPLDHLERTILISLALSIVFTLLALISGLPIVLLLFVVSLPILLIKHTIYYCANTLFSTNIHHKSRQNRNDWQYCPLNYLESYWFKPELVNHCLLFTEQNVTLDELRQLIRDSILQEPEFRKFKARIVTRRFIFSSLYWQCLKESDDGVINSKLVVETDPAEITSSLDIDDITDSDNNSNSNKFSLDDHIIQDEPIASRRTLRMRNAHLLNVPLPADKPLWQIRLATATYVNQCVIIVRCHQSLADGSRLIAILIKSGLINQNKIDQSIHPNNSNNRSWQQIIQMNRQRFVNSASHTSNILKACIVGPFTCFLWCIWAFSRRNYNHLNPTNTGNNIDNNDNYDNNVDNNTDYKRFYMSSYSFAKVSRVKEVTKSTFSEVILCALSGALRDYLRRQCFVDNPPNMNIGLTVDMRGQFSGGNVNNYISKRQRQTTRYVLVNVPLPIAVEGAIPRLWETRHIMEELKSSADPWVMLGFQHFLFMFLPRQWYVNVVNFIVHRNSSLCVSNINQQSFIYQKAGFSRTNSAGGSDGDISGASMDRDQLKLLTIGNKKITKMYFCLQPPTRQMPVSFNCITYNDNIFVSCNSKSIHIDDSKKLIGLFFKQLNSLSLLLGKKKIPGTVRMFTLRPPQELQEITQNLQEQQRVSSKISSHHHEENQHLRSYDLFKLINYPMTYLTTPTSVSVDFIDKTCDMTTKCDCYYCCQYHQANNQPNKTMASSLSSLIQSKPKSLIHNRYCEILNRRSLSFCTNKQSNSQPSLLYHDNSSSRFSRAHEDGHAKYSGQLLRKNKTSGSLSCLKNVTNLDSNISGGLSTEVDTDGSVKSVRRQLLSDSKRRRSLFGVTEHQAHSIVVQKNDLTEDRFRHLRYPTTRKLSVIGLAVGPGRRTSLVPFGSIAQPNIPKSYSGSSNETNV